MKSFFYYENNQQHPGMPQEDAADNVDNIFAVSDGITHDDSESHYPNPSEAGIVAGITVTTLVNYLKGQTTPGQDSFADAFKTAQFAVKQFNTDSLRYHDREQNNYDYGSCVAAAAVILPESVEYGVLDDCRVQVFSKAGESKIELIHYVDQSAEYFYKDHDWNDLEARKFMRKFIRNQKYQTRAGGIIGYGAIDGFGDYTPYLQTGSCKLEPGDLVAVFSDGFIPALNDKAFLELLFSSDFGAGLKEQIKQYLSAKKIIKEKTAFFIKI